MKLKERLLERYGEMTESFRKLADYVLNSPAEIPMLSSAELGRRLGLSNATVIRFAQMLGYEGYIDLKRDLLSELKEELKPEERFKIAGLRGQKDILFRVVKQDVENINQTISRLRRDEFSKIIEQICKADEVFALGVGLSAILARTTSYLLQQVGVNAISSDAEVTPIEEKIIRLNSNDLLIVFSFPPYSKIVLEFANLAHQEGIPILCFTDKPTSPVGLVSQHRLIISNENLLYTNSFAAFSVLINAIATEIALRHKKQLVKENERILKNLERFYL
ncbi:MAG: MurR/RpiR family transcriptional regulator [Acidobacteriota bacterium]|nr:MurR/RpiR family transcriptional regulator [Blastocatellia bacterium]MDW8412778.1 MurR/RpiR family transcriptional regulator [Acidobacteriota bacterium]